MKGWGQECPRYFSAEQARDRLAFVGHGEGALGAAVEDEVEGEAEGVGDGGVEVGDADFVFGDFDAFVGFAIDLTTLNAAAPEDGAEGFRIVVATVVLIDLGCAAEFGGEDDEGVVEQTTAFEVGEECA